MPRRPRNDDGGGANDWLNTYADMVTLLLTFFAVLLSMSNTDEVKLNAFIRSFSNLPQEVIEQITLESDGDKPGDEIVINDMTLLYESLKAYIEESDQSELIDISKVDEIIFIRFSSALFFYGNEYVLRPESIPTIEFIANGFIQYEDAIKMINVLGHTATDMVGRHWLLSSERAAVVASFFADTMGFNPKKIISTGHANQYPVDSGNNEEAWMKNRRVELVIAGNDSTVDFNVYNALGMHYDNTMYPQDGNVSDFLLPVDVEIKFDFVSMPTDVVEDNVSTPTVSYDAGEGESPYE